MTRPLQQDDKRLKATEHMTVGIAHVRLDGKWLEVNQTLSDITGYSVNELLTLTLQDITYPDDLKKDLDNMLKLLEGEINTYTTKKRYIRKDQSIIWVIVTDSLVRKPDGTPIHFMSIIDEIKDCKMAKNRLADTSRLLESIVENVPNMIFLKRASDLRFEFFNCAGEALLGLDRAELLGRNDYDFFPKDQADFFTRKDREVLEQHDIIDIPEEIIETPRGTRVLHTQKITLYDLKGRPQYLLGISEDITERKKAEQTLRSQAKIIDQIHDSVVSTDLDGFVTSWNNGAERMFGYTSNEVLGKHISTVYPEEETPCLKDKVIDSLKEMGAHEVEVRMQRKSGENFYTHLSLSMLYDEHASAIRMIGYTMDITERKRAEAELDKYRHHLEELVDERTADLAAARDEAERANAAKSEFLSRMSHELRTPMNAILGFGQMLKLDAGGLNKTQHSEVKEILDAGNHLLNLIDEVLDLAKIESGRFDIFVEEIPFDDLLHQCINLIKPQIELRQMELIDYISGMGFTVQADFTRLKQVLVNLLSNAVKYNCDHGRITLNGEIIDEQRLRILVTDNGEGLAEEEISKLFTPFERLNAVNNVEGTGIGLVITKHLIELMGGTIGVESTPGEGSTFWVELAMSNDA